jgi:3-hydroxybutyryl-CoA dehydrogenase
MHFFNPVPRSALVELVTSDTTDGPTLAAVKECVERLRKHSIVVRDSPGFATSRLGLIIGLEAIRMVEEEVASTADIDRGMVLGYRFPVGPLELTDLVGLDVRLSIADYLAGKLGPRFDAPRLLRDKVAAGDLGKKTGRGFYDWSSGKPRPAA